MDPTTIKPPWERVIFQQSMYPDAIFEKALEDIVYGFEWQEMEHCELNEVKEQIAPLEAEHLWEHLKKRSNPYELVFSQEAQSVSLLKPLSRSYFKMIEILQMSKFFEQIANTNIRLRSAHVAEGPGGFIEAFLDKAEETKQTVNSCVAMTLKPTNNNIPGWRRTYNFLHKHPEVKINYGSDGTGDLYRKENQEYFIHQIQNQKVMLFTGDGGFDFSVDYQNQEKSVFRLLIASAIVGVQVLQPESTFVLKVFDLFSNSTHLLIRLLSICFRSWVLYKPVTSRPCNSERYLVCKGFRKAYPSVVAALQRMQDECRRERYPQSAFLHLFSGKESELFLQHIISFNNGQIRNLRATIAMRDKEENDTKEQIITARNWCNAHHIPTRQQLRGFI